MRPAPARPAPVISKSSTPSASTPLSVVGLLSKGKDAGKIIDSSHYVILLHPTLLVK